MTEPQKPNRKYLEATEILNLLHNTNKQFPPKEASECPLTKTGEEPQYE